MNGGIEVSLVMMSQDEMAEFYNKCHGEDGRFCEGDDGAKRGPVSGKMAWHTAGNHLERSQDMQRVTDGGSDYIIQTSNGKKIGVSDPSDLITSRPEESMTVLDTVTDLQDIYGDSLNTSKVNIVPLKPVDGEEVYGIAGYDDIAINSELFPGLNLMSPEGKRTSMPIAKTISAAEYVATHEMGHTYQHQTENTDLFEDRWRYFASQELMNHPEFREHISSYGAKNNNEAYAETFTEWHASRGKTGNIAAKALAIQEQWEGWEQAITAPDEFSVLELAQSEPASRNNVNKGEILITHYTNGKVEVFYGPNYKRPPTPTAEQLDKARRRVEEVLAMAKGVGGADTTELRGLKVTEFYNKCHGEKDGRFCEGEKGEAKIVSGRMLGPLPIGKTIRQLEKELYQSQPKPDWQVRNEERDREREADRVWLKESLEKIAQQRQEGILKEGAGSWGEDSRNVFNDAVRTADNNRTDGDKSSVYNYTEYENEQINPSLRNNPDDPSPAKFLDAAFERSSVPTNGITVYRGAHFENADLKVGDIISDDAFLSTSISSDAAHRFITDSPSKPNPVEMEIRSGRDTRAMVGADRELELIFNRSLPMRIDDIEHCPDGICKIWGSAV